MQTSPGYIRDAIIDFLVKKRDPASILEIENAVSSRLGIKAKPSSIRSYLNSNTPGKFTRASRGKYMMACFDKVKEEAGKYGCDIPSYAYKHSKIFNTDCFQWFSTVESNSIHAVVTDPPYGLIEYSKTETEKLRSGKGGVWRIPPSFDGVQRSPLPRFTTLKDSDREALFVFFKNLSNELFRIVVPGGNILIASNPMLVHLVASAMESGGLEMRGYIARQVMTMRGGDRPKNAHKEFSDVSVLPRSQWEPWVILRKPLDGRVQDNLRKWKTGGFRRISHDKPFGDVISSRPTSAQERQLAPHPSLKPQAFMRKIVRASLPLGEGVVLDPFMGAGSTLAAANAMDYSNIGIELDEIYYNIAKQSIPKLTEFRVKDLEPSLF